MINQTISALSCTFLSCFLDTVTIENNIWPTLIAFYSETRPKSFVFDVYVAHRRHVFFTTRHIDNANSRTALCGRIMRPTTGQMENTDNKWLELQKNL